MKTIVVWFSCGAASAVAVKETFEQYGLTHNIRVVNNPIAEEDWDNRRFLRDVEKWLNIEIEIATSEKYPSCSAVEVWEKRKFMSGPKGAPCTMELKKVARQEWEAKNEFEYLVLGFTADEKNRFENFKRNERENILPILIDKGITKDDCYQILSHAGIALPRTYFLGYPNANCIGCVKATSPTYWSLVREKHPHVFHQRAEQSRRIGAKLVRYKNKRIFLDELPVGATGRPLKNMNIECGIFCEERIA
jgi:hypothetical protein